MEAVYEVQERFVDLYSAGLTHTKFTSRV